MGTPIDQRGTEFPLPGTRINDSIVVASCYYRDLDDELIAQGISSDMVLVLLLNDAPPYFTTMVVFKRARQNVEGWCFEQRDDHMNIVHAINGGPNDEQGYTDKGGDV